MTVKERLDSIENLLMNPNLDFEEKMNLKDLKLELEKEIGLKKDGGYDYEDCENCSA